MEQPKVFDRAGSFTFNLKRPDRTITVSFPTDDQIRKRESAIRVYYRRGVASAEQEGVEEADHAMIKSCGDPDIDEDGASRIAAKLMFAEVGEPELSSEGGSVPITVVGGIRTVHVLKEPSLKQIRKHRELSIWMNDPKFGKQEARVNLGVTGELYDKLFIRAEGYVVTDDPAAVPLIHKSVAINALIRKLNEEAGDSEPEDVFLK